MRLRRLSAGTGLALLVGVAGAEETGLAQSTQVASPARPAVIDNFQSEEFSGWVATSHFWADGKGHANDEERVKISLNGDAKYVASGKGSLKVTSWPAKARRPNPYVTLTKQPIAPPADGTDTLSFWVYSEGDKGGVDLRLFNSKTWENACVGIRLRAVGWRRVTFHNSQFRGTRKFGWEDANYFQMVIKGTNSTFHLDDLTFVSGPKPAEEIGVARADPKDTRVTGMNRIKPVEARAGTPVAENSQAKCAIVLARAAIAPERTAAKELAAYLGKVTGADLSVRTAGEEDRTGPCIYVGPAKCAEDCGIHALSLAPEEWSVRTVGADLVLVGGRPRGTLYAVYHLLEDVIGVHWWNPWEEHVPSRETLRIPAVDGHGEPVFGQRCLDTTSHLVRGEPEAHLYAVRNRVNADLILDIPFSCGGEDDFGPPYMCHVEGQYHAAWRGDGTFKEHPDWLAMKDGKREVQSSWTKNQLCLSNPGMRVAFLNKLKGHIRETRGQPVPPMLFDVSLNDVPSLCECDPCQGIVKKHGWGDSGLLLDFVDYLADGIRDEYPGVIIETLAYLDTEPIPTGIKPRPNVAIRLCDTKSTYTAPIGRDSHFVKCLRGWSTLTDGLMVWDYHTNSSDLAQPMPFEQGSQPDLQLCREYGVVGVMTQFHHPVFEDLRDLRLWLLAKLYEDPYLDQAALIETFTDGFYGPAAGHIREYIASLGAAARAKPSNVYTATRLSSCKYLTPAFLHEMQNRFDDAEEAVAGSEGLRRRVRHARIAIDKATVARFPQIWNQWEADGGKPGELPLDRDQVAARLRDTAETLWRLRARRAESQMSPGWRLTTFCNWA